MPLLKAIKDRIEDIVESYIQDEIDLGHIQIDDIIDDLNFVIENCNVKELAYTECVKQLQYLYNESIIDSDDKDYAISQLYSK
jgi:hypothetical protein